jgi:hypothetical protein
VDVSREAIVVPDNQPASHCSEMAVIIGPVEEIRNTIVLRRYSKKAAHVRPFPLFFRCDFCNKLSPATTAGHIDKYIQTAVAV